MGVYAPWSNTIIYSQSTLLISKPWRQNPSIVLEYVYSETNFFPFQSHVHLLTTSSNTTISLLISAKIFLLVEEKITTIKTLF